MSATIIVLAAKYVAAGAGHIVGMSGAGARFLLAFDEALHRAFIVHPIRIATRAACDFGLCIGGKDDRAKDRGE
ncbi:MAG: hypothetical protein AB7F41_06720 [Methylocystis sp.]|uniref:hypothetical protein n=1 Tax=Methylocystis sp. TaxID=1911079 RepID=UPI003D09FF27